VLFARCCRYPQQPSALADKPKPRLRLVPRTSAAIEEAYRAIEEGMGITSPNPAFRNQLSRCVQKWRDQQGPDLTSIKPSKLEAAVSKIRNDAHRLLGDLHRAKGDSQEAWDYEGAAIELCIEPSLAQELGRIIRLADEWLDAQGKGEIRRCSY
jgi:hypothetical protein